MQSDSARVSVVMPVYNGMPFLPEAVQSVLAQTCRDLRLIVVDDGSTDATLEYLESLRDRRLTIMRMASRGGQGAARNAALRLCRTEYVAFADADDICRRDRIRRQVEYLAANPAVGMVGTRSTYLGSSGRTGFAPPLALTHVEIRRALLAGQHALVNGSLMFRTALLRQIDFFRIDGAGEDWDLFLRLTEVAEAANIPDILYLVRIHPGSTNATQARLVQRRYAHACDSARRRVAGRPEQTFEQFCQELEEKRTTLSALREMCSMHSAALYRSGVSAVLGGRVPVGCLSLAAACILSPSKLMQRIGRLRHRVRLAPPESASFRASA